MLSKIDPRTTKSWILLEKHAEVMQNSSLRDLFASEPSRAEALSFAHGEIFIDMSRNLLNRETLSSLTQLANECHLSGAIEAFFSGDPINETENRAVLHTALRNLSSDPVYCEGMDVMPEVKATQHKMRKFCNAVNKSKYTGYTGKKFRFIVNIGIGGSDLGPKMVTEALKPYQLEDVESFFVSNVDGQEISEVLKKVKPESTLFLVVSKTFTTQETMTNAITARTWFLKKAKHAKHVASHFIAISTNEKAAIEFGVAPENIFTFRDWVGGRFSLWGPVGLSIALSIGYKNFEELLRGAHAMDLHFKGTPFERNIPVLLALTGVWYNNFLGACSEAVLPYDQRLRSLPAYLQQASMESNGKGTDRNGQAVEYATAPITWGEPGTNGQHAFFQLLHQGTQLIPCDLIASVQPHHKLTDHHQILLSNMFAQAEALAFGRNEAEMEAELEKQGLSNEEIASILPFRIFSGNRPSNVILMKKLTPSNLGALIALYEHKIFVQGIIWNIYSFDQWGVELGKQLAGKILPQLTAKNSTDSTSLQNLLERFRQWS